MRTSHVPMRTSRLEMEHVRSAHAKLRCCLLLILPAVVQTQVAQTQSAAPGPITIGNVDSIWSPTLKEYRRYQVYTPPAYRQSVYLPRAYPVMYLLDWAASPPSMRCSRCRRPSTPTSPSTPASGGMVSSSSRRRGTTSASRSHQRGHCSSVRRTQSPRFIFADYKSDLFKSLEQPEFITEHFAKVSAKFGYRVLPPERMVDQFSQIELNRDTTKAVALMRLNAELCPRSSHASVLGICWPS